MAPLMTQGAIISPAVRPAMKVCVPHEPKGASMTSLSLRGAHPRSRVRFVFTEVSSRNTTRSGALAIKGARLRSQPLRRFLTSARRRSVATNVFFCTYSPACAGTCQWRWDGR